MVCSRWFVNRWGLNGNSGLVVVPPVGPASIAEAASGSPLYIRLGAVPVMSGSVARVGSESKSWPTSP